MIQLLPWRAALAAVYMAAVFLLSSLPGHQVARLGLSAFLANAAHVPIFAGLSWVTLAALVGPTRNRVVFATMVCLLFAVTDEWHQRFIPGRVMALDDVVLDMGGIALGIVLREGLRPAFLAWRGNLQQ